MFTAHGMTCKECGREVGHVISPTAHRQTLLLMEFACVECVEKVARSEAITLDSETSWGRVIAKIKGR